MENLIGQLIWGLFVGISAKFLMTGHTPSSFITTAIIGTVGAFLGTLVSRSLWGGGGDESDWVAAMAGSIILLAGYWFIKKGRIASF